MTTILDKLTDDESLSSQYQRYSTLFLPSEESTPTTTSNPQKFTSLFPPTAKDTIATSPPSSSGETAAQNSVQRRAKAEKARWIKRFDAAQPSGRSLSVHDWEYQELVRAFRLVVFASILEYLLGFLRFVLSDQRKSLTRGIGNLNRRGKEILLMRGLGSR